MVSFELLFGCRPLVVRPLDILHTALRLDFWIFGCLPKSHAAGSLASIMLLTLNSFEGVVINGHPVLKFIGPYVKRMKCVDSLSVVREENSNLDLLSDKEVIVPATSSDPTTKIF